MEKFNPGHKQILDELLLGIPQVRPGKMFGYPAYFAGRKLCICLYEQGVGFKLPGETAARLLKEDPHAAPFQPLGRHVMREWVQVTLTCSEDYRQYLPLFEESIRYVLELSQAAPGALVRTR